LDVRPAVFVDRDGTLMEDLGYFTPASQLRLFPWSTDAIRLVRRAGFAVVVITNQGGIARRLYGAEFVEQTHRTLADRLAAGGGSVDAWEYCPHHPEAVDAALQGPCSCRKPGVGMVISASQKLGEFDLAKSWVIGDSWRDVQVGHAIGGRSLLVKTGHGARQERSWPAHIARPSAVGDNLIAAVAHILSTGRE
jgi:D-glycero-D-manno-heptose 1,7-bisphosphate phosphatase